MNGRHAVTHEVPRTTVNKESVRLRLFLEPTENFVLFDGQVVAVVHDIIVEILLVMDCPAGEKQGGNEHADKGCLAVQLAAGRRCEVLDHVGDREGRHKSHGRQHHKAIALVDFDAEVARDVFENHIRLQVVEEQKCENLEVSKVPLSCAVNRAEGKIDAANGKEIVEVTQERIREIAILIELCGHHFPVLGEIFEEVSVGFKFASLEAKSLEVANCKECRYGEKRKRHKEDRCFIIFLVEKFRERKKDECEDAEDCFLAGLGEEGQNEGEEHPVHDRVPVICPLEYEQCKSREEYIERFNGHGAELEKYRRLECHE